MRRAGAIILALALAGSAPAAAQDSAAVRPDTSVASVPRDSITYPRAPVRPMGALWRSFLIPGWGQAKLNRKLTGALFVAWEGVTLGMSIKVSHELSYLEQTGSARVSSKRQEKQDWLVLLAFNHLFSAIEAYVSAHLWDFPGDLKLQAVPGGVTGGLSIPLRLQ
jgi:hypothetical protein